MLDRHYLAIKQDLEDEVFPSRYQPSNDILLLKLKLANRVEIWLEHDLRNQLRHLLLNYSGPILFNIDSHRAIRDSILKEIYLNPRLTRNIRLYFNPRGSIDLEKFVSQQIKQRSMPPLGQAFALLPEDPSFYSKAYAYGISALSFDGITSQIYDFPLAVRGALYLLPSNVLMTWAQNQQIMQIKASEGSHLILDDHNVPIRMPLRFYANSFDKKTAIDQISPDDTRILIVEVTDDFSLHRNFRGEQLSWGEVAATALSNLQKKHFDFDTSFSKALIFFIWLFVTGLFLFACLYRLQTALTAFVGGLFLIVGGDLAISLLFSLRTSPIEEVFSFIFLGLVGLSSRAILDVQERSIIEQAFRGYVSDQRLQRLIQGKEALHLKGRKLTLTTMFFDVVGFSKISKELSANQTFELIQKIFEKTDPLIFEFGGVIDKKTGDGFLAFFGDQEESANQLREQIITDSANKACKSALAIQKTLHDNPIYLPNQPEQKIKARIGVNTGEVVIGNAGSQLHFNYTVMGEAVNFTQRLEAACSPEKVLVGKSTFELVKNDFEMLEKQIGIKHEDAEFRAFEIQTNKKHSL